MKSRTRNSVTSTPEKSAEHRRLDQRPPTARQSRQREIEHRAQDCGGKGSRGAKCISTWLECSSSLGSFARAGDRGDGAQDLRRLRGRRDRGRGTADRRREFHAGHSDGRRLTPDYRSDPRYNESLMRRRLSPDQALGQSLPSTAPRPVKRRFGLFHPTSEAHRIAWQRSLRSGAAMRIKSSGVLHFASELRGLLDRPESRRTMKLNSGDSVRPPRREPIVTGFAAER